jgi:hypothetical protein
MPVKVRGGDSQVNRSRFAIAIMSACLVSTACTSSGGVATKTDSPSGTVARPVQTSSSSISAPVSIPASSSKAAGAPSFAGTWTGTYDSGKFSSTSGNFTVTFTQSGSNIMGTIEIHPSCVPAGTVSGTVNGTTISFGQVSGSQRTVSFDGSISGNTMHGTYHSDAACGNDTGTWKATHS